MHLISVDLPAPLSPTRAMTSPGDTRKSTSNSAWTAPKLFETPCSSRTGVSVTIHLSSSPCSGSGGAPAGRPRTFSTEGRSPCTSRRPCRRRSPPPSGSPARRVYSVMLSLVTGTGSSRTDGTSLVSLLTGVVSTRRLLALRERDRELRGRVGLLLDRLVDGHALIAVDDVLDALQRRVLAGDRDLRELALLERRDRGVAEAVVGGEHAVDLVAVLLQDLLEDRQRLLVVPVGHGLVVDLLPVTRVELRVDDRVVAVLEQRRVVVGRRAVQHGDLRALLVAHAVDEALALELADLLVVERDVVVGSRRCRASGGRSR